MTVSSLERPLFQQTALNLPLSSLLQEVAQWEDGAWSAQATGGLGKTEAIPLVSVGGTVNDDFAIAGPLHATPALLASPHLYRVLRGLGVPLGRCRLLRLPAQAETPTQADHSYHGWRYQPLHLPLITDPAVLWYCDDRPQPFGVGALWQFDHHRRYRWVNGSDRPALHVVIEVPIGTDTTALGLAGPIALPGDPVRDRDGVPSRDSLPLVPYCFQVLTADEVHHLLGTLRQDLDQGQPRTPEAQQQLAVALDRFGQAWQRAFEHFGHDRRGELTYQSLILELKDAVGRLLNRSLDPQGPGRWAWTVLTSQLTTAPRPVLRKLDKRLLVKRSAQVFELPAPEAVPRFDRPIFIISTPRAGSTLLYETLSQFPDLWSIGEESHDAIEGIPELHPAAQGYQSNRLTATAATPALTQLLKQRFTQQLQDRHGEAYLGLDPAHRPASIRFLEKTPKNALRVPFLWAMFPDSRFIFLYREAKENISSLMEGWRSRRFIAYRNLPGWAAGDWSFFLPPDWPTLAEATVAEIAARQWAVANGQILADLEEINPEHWCFVPYAELVRHPRQTLHRISKFAQLSWDADLDAKVADTLPVSKMTLSAPSPDKWRKNGQDILAVLPQIQPLIDRLEKLYVDVINA